MIPRLYQNAVFQNAALSMLALTTIAIHADGTQLHNKNIHLVLQALSHLVHISSTYTSSPLQSLPSKVSITVVTACASRSR